MKTIYSIMQKHPETTTTLAALAVLVAGYAIYYFLLGTSGLTLLEFTH